MTRLPSDGPADGLPAGDLPADGPTGDGFTGDGFTVAIGVLRAAGAMSGRVADGVGGVDLTDPATVLAAALPGGTTAAACDAAAAAWKAATTELDRGLNRHGTALAAAAAAYAEADARIAADVRAVG